MPMFYKEQQIACKHRLCVAVHVKVYVTIYEFKGVSEVFGHITPSKLTSINI